MSKAPLTVQGAERLRAELEELKSVRRPQISAAIAEAREHGDLSENAEYHAAREQQGFCESRIAEIESRLAGCEVIDITRIEPSGRVIFGATVELCDLDTDKKLSYQIVGEDEADVPAGKISAASPVARALLGRAEGDEVTVDIPKGEANFEILSVKHL